MSKSIYHSEHLGERARRNAIRQLKNHRAFMAVRQYKSEEERAGDQAELERLEKRLQTGENHCNW